jgi:DNA-binding transcriptional LysR family regulator
MNLTLDQLEVLESIDRFGSFSAAATELHRATSAVSYSVKSLEAALDLELFDRSGHRAVLTDGGRLVLEEARGVLGAGPGCCKLAGATAAVKPVTPCRLLPTSSDATG